MSAPGTARPDSSAAAPEAEAPEAGARPGRTVRQVITLARATFREAVRMKAFAAPVVFAATAAAAGPFLPSDGTPAGAVRLAISVSLVTASIFGAFAAVMLPSLLAAREARDRTAYLVATKPVPRSCLFLGRALGLSCVMAVMFAGMAVLSWVFVRYTALRESRRGDEARAEVAEVLAQRTAVLPVRETGAARSPVAGPKEPFTLGPGRRVKWRFSLPPPRAGVRSFEGRVRFAELESARKVAVRAIDVDSGEARELDLTPCDPPRPSFFQVPVEAVRYSETDRRLPGRVDIELENTSASAVRFVSETPLVVLAGSYKSVPPGGSYFWEFHLPKARYPSPVLKLRAMKASPVAEKVLLRMSCGERAAAEEVLIGSRPPFSVRVPGELLDWRDAFVVELDNTSERPVRVPTSGGLVFAPAVGTFAGALARWTLLETSKAALIVIVTCAAATFLTFPVPALAGGAVALGGYLMAFVGRLLASAGDGAGVGRFGLSLFLRLLLPDLSVPSVAGRIADGAFVPAGFIAMCVAWLVLVRGGVIGLIGAALSARREVGA